MGDFVRKPTRVIIINLYQMQLSSPCSMTLFSTPYYSRLSLLPNDPLPFTMPNYSLKRSKHQPLVSLTDYPLPDGQWRWVSKAWMIDMRTDAGEVQYDGFEYNWVFQKHHWRAEVGTFSAGGLVRRRRWVRLMMRPGTEKIEGENGDHSQASNTPVLMGGSKTPPSLGDSRSDFGIGMAEDMGISLDSVWMGEDPDEDWARCRTVLKCMGRDGRKLEVWKRWLGYCHPNHADKTISETPVYPRKEWVAVVVNKHVRIGSPAFLVCINQIYSLMKYCIPLYTRILERNC